jgi:hypothetical protein
MTHFGVFVSFLVGIFTLLTGILGGIIRLASSWQRVKDMIEFIQKDLLRIITEKTEDHKDFDSRLKTLENERHKR